MSGWRAPEGTTDDGLLSRQSGGDAQLDRIESEAAGGEGPLGGRQVGGKAPVTAPSIDPQTGEVRGTGSGAGGGNPGEDYDSKAGGDESLKPLPTGMGSGTQAR